MRLSHYIHYFTSENRKHEFVVISARPTSAIKDEYAGDLTLYQSLEIIGDATSLPCDRVLARE